MTDNAATAPSEPKIDVTGHNPGMLTALLGRAGRRVRAGRLSVVMPDGSRIVFRGAAEGPSARVVLHRRRALWSMAANASVGLGRSFARGDWDSPDIPALIAFLIANINHGAPATALSQVGRGLRHLAARLRANSPIGSRRNICFHYDIGNDFYGAWLDDSRTYSAALFLDPEMTLEQAQVAKYRRIASQLDLRPGQHVLEIGCGWGGFARFAAREYGVRVTAITLSEEQLAWARRRAVDGRLDGRVEFVLRDYRELGEQYDHIVSIEMLEAVGEKYWPVYFRTLADGLRPGGRACIQCIVIAPDAYASYRKGSDFVQSCIFPGGMLPTEGIVERQAARLGLNLRDKLLFGPHYGRTLNAWRRNFTAARRDILAQGFSEDFYRLWQFYLAYCEGAFSAGRVDVGQWTFRKPARRGIGRERAI